MSVSSMIGEEGSQSLVIHMGGEITDSRIGIEFGRFDIDTIW